MKDFRSDLGEVANCLKFQPISMKFEHSSHNLGNLLHKLEKSNIFHPGPLHGRRERHPHEAHQVEEKSIQLYILYMFYVQFFKPNRYELVSWMSELTRSPSGTSRATSQGVVQQDSTST